MRLCRRHRRHALALRGPQRPHRSHGRVTGHACYRAGSP